MIKISVARYRVCWAEGDRHKRTRWIKTHSQKHDNSIPRRSIVGLSTILLSEFLVQSETKAEVPIESLIPEGFDFGVVSDSTLAYEFLYPKQDLEGKSLPIAFFRKPTQYAAAAPQSVTGRQRIGSLLSKVVIAMSVGPPSSELAEIGISKWTPRDVANDVLADRSVSRLTELGRVPLAKIENARAEVRDKDVYWIYESILSGAPTLADKSKETFRHSLNITCVREETTGALYLYTLSLSCPQDLWNDLSPLFELSATSFRLTSETDNYKSPEASLFNLF